VLHQDILKRVILKKVVICDNQQSMLEVRVALIRQFYQIHDTFIINKTRKMDFFDELESD